MEELLGIQSFDNDNLSPGINQQPCSYRFVCIPECCTTEWSHSQVRMDAGGENVLVSHYMTEMRDIGCNSAMLGRSVHNQRIEHQWRDLFNGCINFFYLFMYFMEDINILNPGNSLDLYAMEYIIMDLLQEHLIGFKNGLANILSELNTTRLQYNYGLWVILTCMSQNQVLLCDLQSMTYMFFYTYYMFYMIHKNGQALTIPAM